MTVVQIEICYIKCFFNNMNFLNIINFKIENSLNYFGYYCIIISSKASFDKNNKVDIMYIIHFNLYKWYFLQGSS